MSDISSSLSKVNDTEVQSEAPLSEALVAKIGGSINGLIDKMIKSQLFTSNGTFTVPLDVTSVIVEGIGGGGGGGRTNAGGGGSGYSGSGVVSVTPGNAVSITIGGGGGGVGTTGGTGGDGGASSFGSLSFPGGSGGRGTTVAGASGPGGMGGNNGSSGSVTNAPGGGGKVFNGTVYGSGGFGTQTPGATPGGGGSGAILVTYITRY